MIKIRKLLILPVVLALSVILTGCSGGSSSPRGEKLTLYWWRVIGDAGEETYEEIAKGFSSQNKSVQIEIVSKRPETYEEEAMSALAAHQSVENAPDIISIPAEDLPRFVPQLMPAPDDLFDRALSAKKKTGQSAIEYVRDNFEPIVGKTTVLNNASGEAKLYGLPIAVDTLALYINRDLLKEASESIETSSRYTKDKTREEIKALSKKIQTPPTTWEALAEIVPYLTVKDGDTITRAGISLGTSKNVERSYDILSSIMMQNGTQLTDNNLNSASFNLSQTGATTKSTPGEEALKFYLRFSNPSDPLYTWNDEMPNSVAAFLQGQLAILPHYASLYVHLINEVPSLKRSIDVSAFPQITDKTNLAGAQGQKVSGRMNVFAAPSAKNDPNRQAASWAFINYLTSKTGSGPYLSAMKLPSALKAVDSKAKFDVFDEQKSIADTWYKGHKAMRVDEIFISMIDDAYTGRKSVLDTLDSASTSVTTILEASKSKWSGQ